MLLKYFIEEVINSQIVQVYNFTSHDWNRYFETVFWFSKIKNVGNMFIAIKGENTNGNLFVEEAISNGYTSIMSDNNIMTEEYAAKYPGVIFIVVLNINDTLNMMARWGVAQFKGIKFAITGSSGKTTTTYLLQNVLKNFGTVVCTDKYNSQYYLKRLCFSLYERKEDYFIAELSSDRLGSIDLYSSIIKPHYSIITSIGTAHLHYFQSEDNILLEKTSLFTHTSQGGFVPAMYKHNMQSKEFLASLSHIHYVEDNFYIKDNHINFIANMVVKDSHLKGLHNISNMNLVIHLMHHLYKNHIIPHMENVAVTLSQLTCFPGRGNRIIINKPNCNITLLCEHHNSNYESFISAMANIREDSLVIMGFLYELGTNTNKKILKILHLMDQHPHITHIFLGDQNLLTVPNILQYKKVLNPNLNILHIIQEHKIKNIFLKGSRGSQLEKYIKEIINNF